MTKNLLLGIAAVCGSTFQAVACTGISLTSRDGSYVQARTIELALKLLLVLWPETPNWLLPFALQEYSTVCSQTKRPSFPPQSEQ